MQVITSPQFVGRKRRTGRRHPSGRLVAEKPEDAKIIAFHMPHRQVIAPELRHDPKAESQLGRYELTGKITKAEYDAGRWYAGVVNRYRAVIEAPKASPSSNAGVLIPVFGGQPYAMDDDEAQRRKAAYCAATELVFNVSQKSAKAVNGVAVYDKQCPADLWRLFRLGLIALALHRGFTTEREVVDIRRKLVDYRNRSWGRPPEKSRGRFS